MLNKCITSLSILLFAGAVTAAPITQTHTFAPTSTNFSSMVAFDKFDNMGGSLVLDSVNITVSAMVNGTVEVESLDAAPSVVKTSLEAILSLSSGIGELVNITLPTVNNVFNATAFDGTLDFAGSSGMSYTNLGGAAVSTEIFTDASTLNFFTGTGTENFTFGALAASFATGNGNLNSAFSVLAGGTITISYESINAASINAPATIALFGFAILGFMSFRRMKP